MQVAHFPEEQEFKKWMREVVREELTILISQLRQGLATDEPPLTRQEIAAYLRISLVTLSDWVRKGLPRHRKKKRGRVLFIKSEVMAWVKENIDLGQE